jgi:hypothetical protein
MVRMQLGRSEEENTEVFCGSIKGETRSKCVKSHGQEASLVPTHESGRRRARGAPLSPCGWVGPLLDRLPASALRYESIKASPYGSPLIASPSAP